MATHIWALSISLSHSLPARFKQRCKQRVAHVLFTFKIFLPFWVCCCFMAAPTRQNDLYVRRGNNIYTNKQTHTHILSGGAYAKRRKVCRTFVWACIEVKCCCLRCPLCCRAATATATLRQLCFSSGQMQMPFHKDKWSSKQQQQQQQKLQQQQVKREPAIAFDKRFCSLEKALQKVIWLMIFQTKLLLSAWYNKNR